MLHIYCIQFVQPCPLRIHIQIRICTHTYVGMGIRSGVTLIVGGGFHGKTTLLNALEVGVYNHIPGDGRYGHNNMHTLTSSYVFALCMYTLLLCVENL